MPPRNKTAGFTLLEAIVAFMIAALALTALFDGGLGGLRAASVSAQYKEAISRAESHLAAASVGDALASGDRQGDEGHGYHWRVRISPALTLAGAVDARAPPPLTLYTVSVAISWSDDGRTRQVELDTQRAGLGSPRAP